MQTLNVSCPKYSANMRIMQEPFEYEIASKISDCEKKKKNYIKCDKTEKKRIKLNDKINGE